MGQREFRILDTTDVFISDRPSDLWVWIADIALNTLLSHEDYVGIICIRSVSCRSGLQGVTARAN